MVQFKQGEDLRAAIADSFGEFPMVVPISFGLSSVEHDDTAETDADKEMVFEALSRFKKPMEEDAAIELVKETANRCETPIGQHAIYRDDFHELFEHV